jgi:hypothetical protein
VIRKQREALDNAARSVKKHEVILDQLGVSSATKAVNAPTAAAELESLFHKFLADVKPREVPLHANLDGLFNDYFARTPPVLSSLRKSAAAGPSYRDARRLSANNR